MKHSDIPTGLTVEDFCIWLSLAARSDHLRYPFVQPSLLPADRRDACLMLELAELRIIGAYADVRMLQTCAGQDGYSVGGWMRHYRWVSPNWSDGTPRKDVIDV